VDPRSCTVPSSLPYTCGSPGRQALIRYLVLQLLKRDSGQGVSQAWLDRASEHIRIPQSQNIESLNVGSSSAVCLFEQFRQRR
ncbi:MAG: TrmH family RNA methyltransferase, partial [Limnobacter sp.]